jgi:hypothetical protein
MISLTIGSLQLMQDGTDTGYTVEMPIEGLDAAEYRESLYDKPGEDGAVLSSLFYGPRIISLPGHINATQTAAQYETKRRALATACAVRRDVNGQPLATRLSLTTRGGSSYFVDVFPRKPKFDYEYATTGNFQLHFVAPISVIYGSAQVSSGAISRPTGGGFTLPFILPVTSSATTGGSVTVANSGNTTSAPILTLTGPLTNPYVSNSATGEFVQLNYTIPGGSFVVIDMANKTVMLNGNSTILSVRTTDSSWWGVLPGSNSISLSTSSTSDTGNAVVTFYNAWSGI